jgi:hypothetical protein
MARDEHYVASDRRCRFVPDIAAAERFICDDHQNGALSVEVTLSYGI